MAQSWAAELLEKPHVPLQLHRFDLNLLLALDALLRERNVTRAAERVFVSQPAMSGALAKLRGYFDDPLLVRVGRELQLTPRALALAGPVREAILQVEAALGTRPTFDPGTARRAISMMVPDFLVPLVMPRILRQLVHAAPGIRVQLENWSQTGPARLESGDIDFFVAVDAPRVLGLAAFPESLCRAELCAIRWVCVASRDHPSVGDSLTREEFLRLPQVYVRAPGNLLPVDEAVRRQLHVELDVRVTTESVLEVPFIVAGTPLVAVLPEHLAAQLADCLGVRILELPVGLVPRRRVDIFWHKRNEPDPAHAWMREIMLQILRQPGSPA